MNAWIIIVLTGVIFGIIIGWRLGREYERYGTMNIYKQDKIKRERENAKTT